jgi:diacylglycerol kinase family enzyme
VLKDYLPWIVVGAVVAVGVVAVTLLSRTRPKSLSTSRLGRRRPHRDHFRRGEKRQTPVRHAAIIVNPTKVHDLAQVQAQLTLLCQEEGWAEPRFYETTIEDPGTGQARQAVADGAAVVCSLGGDGTVRHVATGLVGTETPLGILPAGTGNLLARTLDMPVGSLASAVRTALTGRNRRIDVGEVVIEQVAPARRGARPDGARADGAGADSAGTSPAEPAQALDADPDEAVAVSVDAAADADAESVETTTTRHQFLVMTGIGMDAAIMQGTNENLKATVGWGAYVVSGLKHLVSPEFRVAFRLDDEPEFKRRARAVVIGNCGKLLGGLVLMPDARVDDEQLDVVIASPKGFVGWAPVIARALTRQRKGHSTLDHKTCREVRIRTDRALPVQVDGDVVAEATEVTATVRPAALTVRVSQV